MQFLQVATWMVGSHPAGTIPSSTEAWCDNFPLLPSTLRVVDQSGGFPKGSQVF